MEENTHTILRNLTNDSEKEEIEKLNSHSGTNPPDNEDEEMNIDNKILPTASENNDNLTSDSFFESNITIGGDLNPIIVTDETNITNETLININQTIEQENFEKPNESFDSVSNNTIDFGEKSVNISQINVENQDDSNDAFNALKRNETDALNELKDVITEHSEINSEQAITENDENRSQNEDEISNVQKSLFDDANEINKIFNQDKDIEKAIKSNIETCEKSLESNCEGKVHSSEDKNVDEEFVNSPNESNSIENHGIDEVLDDIEDNEMEITNEGEGIDINLCLLGDSEDREITEAEKEKVIFQQEMAEDDTSQVEKQGTNYESKEVEDEECQEDISEEFIETNEYEENEGVIDQSLPMKENEIREIDESQDLNEEICLNCENFTKCHYRVLEESGEIRYLCSYNCIKDHREDNPEKYILNQKKVFIYEQSPQENTCSVCLGEKKNCKYYFRVKKSILKQQCNIEQSGSNVSTDYIYICDCKCLQNFIGGNDEKYTVKEVKRRSIRVRDNTNMTIPQYSTTEKDLEIPKIVARTDAEVEASKIDRDESFIRRCAQCCLIINFTSKSIQWETFDFCNEKCINQYLNTIGQTCVKCQESVSLASLGKLCVRFGYDLRQFCCSKCLDEFKKTIKHCALCQCDLSKQDDVILAQVGEKKVYRDFCNEKCLKDYEKIINLNKKQSIYLCSVCNHKKIVKIEMAIDGEIHRFCSNPCFSAFKFVNNVVPDQCDMCMQHFERKSSDAHTIYIGKEAKIFCAKTCKNIYIRKHREIWQCNWCKVSKYSFDMIQLNFGNVKVCSLNCLTLFYASQNTLSQKRSKCAHCRILKQPQYHLTMSDSTTRQFCTYQCAIGFQGQFKNINDDVIPVGTAKRIKPAIATMAEKNNVPIISRVQSLSHSKRSREPYNPVVNRSRSPIPVPEITVQLERLSDLPSRVKIHGSGTSSTWTPISTTDVGNSTRVEHKTQVVTIPSLPAHIINKSTMCKPITLNKSIHAIPSTLDVECQTDDYLEKTIILPIPIPIYIPQPIYMYSLPAPIPVPIPLPIPVPVFIPTTRNSANGIMKEIKKIQDKMPTDPYEAELLMMAEMVAGDRKREQTDSDSDEENEIEYGDGLENNPSFNEDLVQMAFKMASGNDFDDPPVDLENEMTANTISQNAHGYDDMDPQALHHHQLLLLHQQQQQREVQSNRGRKRMSAPIKQNQNNARNVASNKRIKREMEVIQPEMPREPVEKPDANMCLKFTFGVNAWKQWVATKNADLEKSSIRRKPIKSEILQLTADELNYSLCMFVKEVRKPNGSEYAPDTIYYLVLGIQQYLYENGRIDNIFTDRYYEQFTDCLDEVAKKFSVLYNDSQYIVTRVEEEHLWESKQLGAHSPHVLLSTLMFFNTKHFNLVTVDEHMELSFSHIMKHWKRNPNQSGATKMPGSRNVLLRFYPPQSSLDANSRKKKVYEQQENEDNPLRCPVKLYEFYLSKCPESVKTRNDVFYLQPERSCVPDSPVWYSTQALSREALSKMLHRVKMVKEINIALLTS